MMIVPVVCIATSKARTPAHAGTPGGRYARDGGCRELPRICGQGADLGILRAAMSEARVVFEHKF
jgi:hypothetical protein